MTRANLVARIAEVTGWPRAASDRAVRAMLTAMRSALRRGDAITLVGFGTFSVTRRRPRTIRHPRTGHPSQIPLRVARFKPSRELRRAVR